MQPGCAYLLLNRHKPHVTLRCMCICSWPNSWKRERQRRKGMKNSSSFRRSLTSCRLKCKHSRMSWQMLAAFLPACSKKHSRRGSMPMLSLLLKVAHAAAFLVVAVNLAVAVVLLLSLLPQSLLLLCCSFCCCWHRCCSCCFCGRPPKSTSTE